MSSLGTKTYQDTDLSVVIPVYNGMPFLVTAVESILQQTYRQFNLLVIDDGSTDESFSYLQSITDSRLKLLSQTNIGLCRTLNETISGLKTKYVARLDQDDIAFPYRLFEQRRFLEENAIYEVVLGNIERIGSNGRSFGLHIAYDPKSPVAEYSSRTFGCIVHSTLMMHVDAFRKNGGYQEIMYPVDDYDLLLRWEEVMKIAVLTRPMVKYRVHGGAGTFKTYRMMEWKTKLAHENSDRRRRGEKEIKPDIFQNNYAQRGVLEKLFSDLSMFGRLNFRKAGMNISQKKYINGFMQLIAAFFFAPRYSFGRLLMMVRTRS
jgi:glycosyltransferase involved in cell wall biosynthesis